MHKKRFLLVTLVTSVFAIGCSISDGGSSESIRFSSAAVSSSSDEGISSTQSSKESNLNSDEESSSQNATSSEKSEASSSNEESSSSKNSHDESSTSNHESSEEPSSSENQTSESSDAPLEEGKTLKITFGTAKTSDSKYVGGEVEEVATLEGDNIISSLEASNCYFSKIGSAMRIGSKDSGGSLVFNLRDEYHVNAITLNVFAWGSDETTVKIGISANTFSDTSHSPTSSITPFTYSVNSDISSFTISSIKNGKARFLLSSLSIDYGYGSLPPSSSSSESSSSEDHSSSEEESSSSNSEPTKDDSNYYSSINWSKRGSALKSDLCSLIGKNYKSVGYSSVASYYTYTDTDDDGKIIDIYSSYRWNVNDNNGNYKNEGDVYNKEHIMPQSVFSERSPMKSDIHHLFPTDGYVNNRRSNYPHGYVASPTYTSTNGTKIGSSASSKNHGYGGAMVCEPIDEYKGDVARAYFYMVTRYGNLMSGWGNYAVITNNSFPSLSKWAIATYLEWNDLDPVSEKEIKRNNEIYKIQNNRNPFVDHPEASHYIWDSAFSEWN